MTSLQSQALPNQRPTVALVTAGPTEEPIDAVRFLSNRSSGRMGIAIAQALVDRGIEVILALGPVRNPPAAAVLEGQPHLQVLRYGSAGELETLLRSELPKADLVVMAAAVADFRPRQQHHEKLRRTDQGMTLELEPVPDLLATTRDARKLGAAVYGFALEPRERLERSALEKLTRKDLAGIVANPLETMESPDIDGVLFLRDGSIASPGKPLTKEAFAAWLSERLLCGLSPCTAHA